MRRAIAPEGPRVLDIASAMSYTMYDMARLSARIDDNVAKKIELLKQRTSLSTTEVLKAAIERYFEHEHVEATLTTKLKGLVGVTDGPKNLSTDYKQHIAADLTRKV